MKRQWIMAACLVTALAPTALAQQPEDIRHVVAAIEEGKFHGWPANNGVWQWGNEILVGFTQGDLEVRDGHNITGIQKSLFARSKDGGETWSMFDPENFLDDENIKWLPAGKTRLETPLNFEDDGFAMRVFATGYHGNDDPDGGFYYSYDRGSTWNGPHFLGDIHEHEAFQGNEITARTDYIVTGPKELFIFLSMNDLSVDRSSRVGCIKTEDGGLTFQFVSWVTPATEDYRAIMPSTVRLSEDEFLTTFRKINRDRTRMESSIETYVSDDRGTSWRHISTVREMKENSNPPATVLLDDGRVCCIYGDRDTGRMCGKYSSDQGKTWGDEFVIREHYGSLDTWADMGYPRLVQRPDGKLVAMYYWASPEHPQHHIAASIWTP